MGFIVNNPVKREVFASTFRDRIVHHLIYNWLSPVYEKIFIDDSYSCRIGRGTLFGIQQLEKYVAECSHNYTRGCWILKLDIEGYFMHINRKKLYDMMVPVVNSSSEVDRDLLLYLLRLVVFNDPTKGCRIRGSRDEWNGLPKSKSLYYSPEGCGLPIGNLTSQLFSNVYLNALDQYVTKTLGFGYYGRYVDDFYIVDKSRKRLLEAIPEIQSYLQRELCLNLHKKKIYLQHYTKGVNFLGAKVQPKHRIMNEKSLRRMHGRVNDVLCFEENPYKVYTVLQSYMGYKNNFNKKDLC